MKSAAKITDLRLFTAFACIALGFLLGVFFLAVYDGHLRLISGSSPEGITMEYKDLISIILTALGVMIAVFSLGLAGLAVWGYNEIKENASKKAIETVLAQLRQDGELWPAIEKTLMSAAEKIAYTGVDESEQTPANGSSRGEGNDVFS